MNLFVRCYDVRKKKKKEEKTPLSFKREFSNTYQLSLIITQITFEGISGSSSTGDIAIDDVSLMEGICTGKNFD